MSRRGRIMVALIASLGLFAGASVVAAPTSIDGTAAATRQAARRDSQQVGDGPAPPPAPATATYRVTLHLDWTSATHPTTLPPNAHISPPIVATHQQLGDMFQPGTLASPGVEAMAERGLTSTLVGELNARGTVTSVQTATGLSNAGTRTFTVTLTQDASFVSLVTMLAPSPDWFVGVREQFFVDGQWRADSSIDLGDYDSGTDSASTFVHSNADSNPAQPISGPRDAQFSAARAENRFGFVTFTRI